MGISKVYIGIDPDISESGVAVVREGIIVSLDVLNFFDMCDTLTYMSKAHKENLEVHIESAHLMAKSNWHGGKKGVSDRISRSVGENGAVAKLLIEFCGINHIKYIPTAPAGKLNQSDFRRITGYSKKTNQEERDACMLVYALSKKNSELE